MKIGSHPRVKKQDGKFWCEKCGFSSSEPSEFKDFNCSTDLK